MHLITFLPHHIYQLKLSPGNKYKTSPRKGTPWHQGVVCMHSQKLREGSFLWLLQEEIFLISGASIQLQRRPFPGTHYPVTQAGRYQENFKRNAACGGQDSSSNPSRANGRLPETQGPRRSGQSWERQTHLHHQNAGRGGRGNTCHLPPGPPTSTH